MNFTPEEISPKVYNENEHNRKILSLSGVIQKQGSPSGQRQLYFSTSDKYPQNATQNFGNVETTGPAVGKVVSEQMRSQEEEQPAVGKVISALLKPSDEGRPVEVAYTNVVFRVLVWQDMLDDLIRERAIWGMGLGYPQRSISLEILNWASSEWQRDGWITPHNAALHVVYRAGILGVFFLVAFFYLLWKITNSFIRHHSLRGVALVSVIIYWLILSNFLVILELPHYAIPFWSLWGLLFGYEKYLRKRAKGKLA